MNVSHLSIDEVEHELLIRNILYGLDEHESIKRRKLKDRMRTERENNTFVASPSWRAVTEEISIISANLRTIGKLLISPKLDARLKEKLCTRLVHYRVRTFMLVKSLGAEKHLEEIYKVGKQASRLFLTHFPEKDSHSEVSETSAVLENEIGQALEEVRSEIEILNETASAAQLEEIGLLEEASGGVEQKTLKAKKDQMEASVIRSDKILEILSGLEEGKQESVGDMIKHFKAFVLSTTEQQKLMREKEIAMEEKRRKEAEENIE